MSYLVLARKSRPQSFSQVVGQQSVVKTLQNSIKRNRVAHAILFSGVRGVGKTTLARIMAKAINCEGETDSPPCNECPSCREITAGSALDLIEIDGASNRGIQEIRELKEKIKFMPTSCRYKVIIIDEVHMLTTEAFNALLKTLEEPPEHVHFMFATTELHKIPITILSRCQQYELKRIPAAELTAHFEKLAAAEGVTMDPAALSLIVREAEGSVRDGLSLLDQVFSFGDSNIGVEDVTEVLGLVNRDVLTDLTSALLHGDSPKALQSLQTMFEYGMDIKRFSADLLEWFRTMLLIKIDGCGDLIDLPETELHRFSEISRGVTAQTIHLQLNLLMKMVEEVRYSSQPRLAIETGLLKIIEAGNVVPVSDVLKKLEILLESEGGEPSPAPPGSGLQGGTALADKKKTVDENRRTATPQPEPPVEKSLNIPPLPPEPSHFQEQPATVPVVEPGREPSPVTIHANRRDIRKDWPDFLSYVKDRKVWMAQVLNRADSVKEVGSELQLHYTDSAECSLLKQKENRTELTEFVLDFFQKELTVQFILPEEDGNGDDSDTESPRQKRNQLANDPLTIMTAEIFNGQVGDIRIGPRSR